MENITIVNNTGKIFHGEIYKKLKIKSLYISQSENPYIRFKAV